MLPLIHAAKIKLTTVQADKKMFKTAFTTPQSFALGYRSKKPSLLNNYDAITLHLKQI